MNPLKKIFNSYPVNIIDDVPDEEHYVVVRNGSVYIPGDQRKSGQSRTWQRFDDGYLCGIVEQGKKYSYST